jgi:hypothetical protein
MLIFTESRSIEQPMRLRGIEKLRAGDGAQGRDRTTDTAIFSRMLYQLSYLGAAGPKGLASAGL